MENLFIEKTRTTPEVMFNTSGEFMISGISIPENIMKFYIPVLAWLLEFQKTNPKQVILRFKIDYLNTSSCRMFVELIELVMLCKTSNTEVRFVWCYEKDDEDILELGEDLQLSSKANFEFVAC